MKINFEINEEDFIIGRFDNIINSKMQKIIDIAIIYFVPIILSKFLCDIMDFKNIYIFIISYIFFLIFGKYFSKNSRIKKIEKIINKSKNNDPKEYKIFLEISNDGLNIAQNKISIFLPWNVFTKVVENEKFIHIYNKRNIKIFIPKKCFNNDEDKNKFKNSLKIT